MYTGVNKEVAGLLKSKAYIPNFVGGRKGEEMTCMGRANRFL